MKESFYMREADHYFRKCLSLFPRYTGLAATEQNYSVLSERSSPAYLTFPPEHVRPFELSGQSLIEALNASFESPSLFPDHQTYFVMDISNSKETPYNTIIYQLNGSPKKSTETTSIIMNRYFDSKCFSYSSMKKFGESMGYKRSLPYILGETYFIPDRGATKKPASWYALHHVAHFEFNTLEKKLVLFSQQYPLLTLDLSKSVFEKQLNIASHLYFIQTRLVDGLLTHFELYRKRTSEENIVHKHLERVSYRLPNFTAQDYLHFLTYFEAQQMITTIFGEDNPYLEDSRNQFQLPKISS